MFQIDMSGPRTAKSGRRSRNAGVTALLAVALLAQWAHGQSTQQPASSAPSQSITAEEVSLDLVVHDKKSRPVLDLKPGEIAVTDDGSPVTLNSLRLVSGKPDSARLVTLVFDRPNPSVKLITGDVVGLASKAAATNPWSLYDQSIMNTARDAAAKILKMIPESGFSIAVTDVEGHLRIQQRFTSDRKAIAQAVNAATELSKSDDRNTLSQPEHELIATARTGADASGKAASVRDRALAEALTAALYDSGRIAQDQHLRPSLAGLLALVQSQQKIAQRKVVIYFTFSTNMEFDSHAENSIPSIIGAANRAGVSLYIVDLNSLDTHGSRNDAADTSKSYMGVQISNYQSASVSAGMPQASSPGMAAMESAGGLGMMRDIGEDTDNNGALQRLAQGTGGSYITRSHLRKPLEQMIQDMTNYYEATYVPAIKEYDGRFRPVAVKPLRKGLRIRTQTGYLALPPRSGDGGAPQAFELPLLKILSATPLPADQAFHAAILHMGDSPDGNMNTVALEAPLSSLDIREDSSTNLYSAHLSLIANIKDKTGAIIEHFSEDIPRRGALRNLEAAKSDAITMQRHFVAPAGQYVLEAAVLDDNSGKSGAQQIPFEIPAESGGPSLSDIVLVRRMEPARPEDDPSEPLVYADAKVTPNLSGQLPPGARKVTLFFIAHTDPRATGATALNIQMFKDGKQLAGAPLAAPLTGRSGNSSYLPTISVNQPMDGLYEVKAILSQGEKTAETKASFTLEGVQAATDLYAAATGNDASAPEVAPPPPGPLAITFPTNSGERPAPDELKSMLADATQFADDYSNSLPNFMCEQVTNRLVDTTGKSEWKQKDKITERLVYFEHEEKRSLLELERNGFKTHEKNGHDNGVLSYGEFGSALKGIFQPSSKADFQWKETGVLGDGKVQVFDYRVARENSTLDLELNGQELTVGFHGQVFIDSATRSVRRFTETADNLPDNFRVRSTSISVDYDYAAINNHDYLVPVGAQIVVRQRHRETDLNQIEFRKFRRYGSNVRILEGFKETTAKPE